MGIRARWFSRVSRLDNGPTTILAHVGISLLSVEQTCTNAEGKKFLTGTLRGSFETAKLNVGDILSRVQVNNNVGGR